MHNYKIKSVLFVGLLFIVLFGSLVIAESMGISSIYSKENPLTVSVGESFEFSFLVQNGKSSPITIEAFLLNGSEVVSFVEGKTYEVPAEGSANVKLKVDIPSDAEIGKEYPLVISFKEVAGNSDGGDTVQFADNIQFSFPIIVAGQTEVKEVATPSEGNFWTWVIFIIAFIVLILFIWVFFRNKNR